MLHISLFVVNNRSRIMQCCEYILLNMCVKLYLDKYGSGMFISNSFFIVIDNFDETFYAI